MSDRSIPSPRLNPEAKPFFEGAAEGRLLIKYCAACGQYHHIPRSLCPFCFSDQTEWREARGMGTIYSFTVLRRAVPAYCIAYVTLDERVSIFTNIVDCDLDAVHIGQRVRVVFKRSGEGVSLPMFAPET